MKIIGFQLFLITIVIAFACRQKPGHSNVGIFNEQSNKYDVQSFNYNSLTIPEFFKTLIDNHLKDFYVLDSASYSEFCKDECIIKADSNNIKTYFSIKILHDLFTCQTSSDCSKGKILDIPYLWHWVTPNPRHEIYFTNSNCLLSKTKSPPEFSKYSSFADIDRTPYLFLSDLVYENPRYYSVTCDTFSTFGWCSEREMAFVALMKLLNYEGKVIADGNHSWSEFLVPMKLFNREIQNFTVTVDNTFNSINWTVIQHEEIINWSKKIGKSDRARWYNKMAKSPSELSKINQQLVSKNGSIRIEKKTKRYLETKLNEL